MGSEYKCAEVWNKDRMDKVVYRVIHKLSNLMLKVLAVSSGGYTPKKLNKLKFK